MATVGGATMSGEAIGAADRVRQVEVPTSAQALSTLARIDYADTFLVDVGPLGDRTAEQLAREVLEGAPLAVRTRLLSGWTSIGLKIDKGPSKPSVLGWQLRQSTPDHVLLGADSRIGMPGELLFKKDGDTLVFATFVQQGNLIARGVWAMVEPAHVRIVRNILDQASRRLRVAD
jgi:hypothetical protein